MAAQTMTGMSIAGGMEAWIAYRLRLVGLNLVAESTWLNQTAIARHWVLLLLDDNGAPLKLDAIRKSHIEIAMGMLLQTRAPVTVQGDMNVLRQMLNWAVDEQLLAAKPRLPVVKVEEVERPLPSDEAFIWALEAVPPRHARALEFMMLMGLAPHELERLRREDACPRPGSIVACHPPSRTGPPIPKEPQPLGIQIGGRMDFRVKQFHRRRWIPMEGPALAIWTKATADQDAPFPMVGTMEKMLGRRRISAAKSGQALPHGAADVTPKMMRKWFSSKMSSPGEDGRPPVPEHVLQRLLGHAPGSKITRKHYVRSSEDQCDEAMRDGPALPRRTT